MFYYSVSSAWELTEFWNSHKSNHRNGNFFLANFSDFEKTVINIYMNSQIKTAPNNSDIGMYISVPTICMPL